MLMLFGLLVENGYLISFSNSTFVFDVKVIYHLWVSRIVSLVFSYLTSWCDLSLYGEKLLVLVLCTFAISFPVSRSLLVRNLVPKYALRCCVALVGLLPAYL